MQLTGRILRVDDVSSERRDEMFDLMSRHFEFVRRAEFDDDLSEKDWVIEMTDRATNVLCGFSTQMVFDFDTRGRTVKALFSGDTIVDPMCWHRNPLAGLWGRLVLWIIDQHPRTELYWILISKGYKTYRFLPTFFHEFFPRYDVATPCRADDVLNAFGRNRHPAAYDSMAGVIRAGAQSCRLRSGLAEVTPTRLRDPHVRFFHQRNPHHMSGDELCCLAPLTRENFTRAAHKVIDTAPDQFPDFEAAGKVSATHLLQP